MRSYIICTLHHKLQWNLIRDDVMGGAFTVHGGDEK
jgi:hypothetical protein